MRLLLIALFAGLVAGSFTNSLMSQTPAPRSKRVNPKDGLTYVWIPPGTFMMGCSPGDGECQFVERPAHRVSITKGFWIGETEATQAAYEGLTRSKPSHFTGALLPVETISWDEAGAYCKGVGMRLPTEAEWEYAARGGNPSARVGPPDAVAWYRSNSDNQTYQVAKKQPNGHGLYDMLGNVAEWVADWWDSKYYGSSPLSDPQGPSNGHERVVRGGSWVVGPDDLRTSSRLKFAPESRYGFVGVRCAGNELPRR